MLSDLGLVHLAPFLVLSDVPLVSCDMCIFCDIAEGRGFAHIVFEEEHSMAFLDLRPLFVGHVLLIPRIHFESLAELPMEMIQPLFAAVQLLSKAVPDAMGADGSLVLANNRVSQSVPHLHVHIVPRRFKDGLRGFLWPRKHYEEGEAESTADSIRASVERLR